MKYRSIPYNASEGNNYLRRYKIQKQYTKRGKWFDVKHGQKVIAFKEDPIQIVQTLNNKHLCKK